jgi:hypothetical protein
MSDSANPSSEDASPSSPSLRGHAALSLTQVAPGAGGRRVWSQGHFHPVRDASGRPAYVVLTHIDLTERI